MKTTGQGKKEFVVRKDGKVSELLTINKAVRIALWYESIGIKVEMLHINEFVGA